MSLLGLLLLAIGIGGTAALMAQNDTTQVQVDFANQVWTTDLHWLVLASAGLGAIVIIGLAMLANGASRARRTGHERRRLRREHNELMRERDDLAVENERLVGAKQAAEMNAADATAAIPHVSAMEEEQAPGPQAWPSDGPVTYPQTPQTVQSSHTSQSPEMPQRRQWTMGRRGHVV